MPPQPVLPPTAAPYVPGGRDFSQTLRLAAPIAAVWSVVRDPHLVAACMPGARLESVEGDRLHGEVRAAFGPIVKTLVENVIIPPIGLAVGGVDFSSYKLLIVPALYVADDALLKRISDYIRRGGRVVMTFKSGFANENAAVRWTMAPGPLREALGFHYQEFSNLAQPLTL